MGDSHWQSSDSAPRFIRSKNGIFKEILFQNSPQENLSRTFNVPFPQKLQGISSCCLQPGVLLQAQQFCCQKRKKPLRIISTESFRLIRHQNRQQKKEKKMTQKAQQTTNLSLSSTFSSERSRSCSIRTNLRATWWHSSGFGRAYR